MFEKESLKRCKTEQAGATNNAVDMNLDGVRRADLGLERVGRRLEERRDTQEKEGGRESERERERERDGGRERESLAKFCKEFPGSKSKGEFGER